MIVFLQGVIHRIGNGHVDVDVGGVGYRVWMAERDLPVLQTGMDVMVFTHHHIREDDESLYGFLDEADKQWFELLLSVSGIGPKVALHIVSASQFDGFVAAITGEDAGSLAKLPGIGKKTAERLILELKDKLKASSFARGNGGRLVQSGTDIGQPHVTAWSSLPPLATDVVEALQSLGYNERQAMEAVAATSLDDSNLSIEEAIRRCLAYFNPSRTNRSASR